jgi:hypothetical protein
VDNPTAERIARNEATFRDANEQINRAALKHEMRAPVPFVCECAEPGCTDIVRVSLSDYERVRSRPTWFLCRGGHEAAHADDAIVEHRDGWIIVEKRGRAGEVAAELYDRSGG